MPALPLSRRQALVVAGALALVLVLAGKLLTGGGQTHRSPAFALPRAAPPTPPPQLVVDVAGAVRRPGLYRLPQGSRIADALARAGGATAKAAVDGVNLAAPLADGEQVVVPLRVAGGGAAAAAAAGASGASGPVSLSTATEEQLDALPGIGPVTAQKIVDYRKEHGAFHSVDELDAISGIGPAKLDQLQGLGRPVKAALARLPAPHVLLGAACCGVADSERRAHPRPGARQPDRRLVPAGGARAPGVPVCPGRARGSARRLVVGRRSARRDRPEPPDPTPGHGGARTGRGHGAAAPLALRHPRAGRPPPFRRAPGHRADSARVACRPRTCPGRRSRRARRPLRAARPGERLRRAHMAPPPRHPRRPPRRPLAGYRPPGRDSAASPTVCAVS